MATATTSAAAIEVPFRSFIGTSFCSCSPRAPVPRSPPSYRTRFPPLAYSATVAIRQRRGTQRLEQAIAGSGPIMACPHLTLRYPVPRSAHPEKRVGLFPGGDHDRQDRIVGT